MSDSAIFEDSLQAGLGDALPARDPRQALNLSGSVVLHGLILILLFLGPPLGMAGSHGALQLVPIEFVSAVEAVAIPDEPKLEHVGKGEGAAGSLPAPSSAAADIKPVETASVPDAFQTKLQSLARLRQPDSEPTPAEQGASTAAASAASDNAAPGRFGSLKDSIRVQVERHWSFTLGSLGNGDMSVPIAVDITDHGTVLKAELLDTARNSDPAYRDVAMSARNAVLLASPLRMPEGDYDKVMHLVLYLNPRRALQ